MPSVAHPAGADGARSEETAIANDKRLGGDRARPRLEWVDTGRGIAILLVALFHSTNWIAGTGIDVSVWVDISAVLATLRMPLFFVLSGLFAAKWLTASWGDLLRTKVFLFGWVLVIWAAIGMTVQLWGLYVAGQSVNLLAGARDVVLAPIHPPFELWFIWALALFFIVAKLMRSIPPMLQLGLAGLLSVVALTLWLTTTTGLTGSAKYYFFFLGGLYLRRLIVAFTTARLWLRLSVLAGWAVLSLGLYVLDLRSFPGAYFVNCIVGVFAGVTLSLLMVRLTVLARLGRQTLPIYLAHTPLVILLSIAIITVPPLLVAATAISWIVPPLAAGVAVAGAVGLHKIAGRSFLRYLYEPPRSAIRVLGGAS